MEKKNSKFAAFGHCLILAALAVTALASGSSKEVINSPEFQDGFNFGWKVGESLAMTALSAGAPSLETLAVEQPSAVYVD